MKTSRTLTVFALLVALTVAQSAVGQTPASAGGVAGTATAAPDHIALSWTGDPATTMTVTWRTDATVDSGFVEYQAGTEITASAQKVPADAREFKTDLGLTRIFSATLTGLSPNTKYAYRVGQGENWSSPYAFTTADPKARSFKFLVFGDSQSPVTGEDLYGVWRKTLHNAFAANPEAKFFINAGDLVDFGQVEAHWDAWFAAAKGVIDTIPAMPVTGNHESYGSRDTWKPLFFTSQFTLPQNGPASLKNQAYSFDYGPVHFIMLDSQGEEQRRYGDILSIQQSWMASDLASSDATWKIAVFHRSPYGVKMKRDEKEIREAFCPILERNGVELAFTAHDHGIKRTFPIRNGSVVENPLQGTTYIVTGRSGAKTYEDIEANQHSAFFYAPLDQPNYLVVEIADQKITVKIYLQDGTLLDTYSMEKPRSAGGPPMGGMPFQF
jgi:hypothetical protein